MVIETILRPLVDLQTASARCNSKQTILRPLVDLQTASKRSNGYRDHFEAVSGFANGVKEVKWL